MTNFEKLKEMDSRSFTTAILALMDSPFKNFVDWTAYMEGESELPTDYLKSSGVCRVLPSNVEVTAALGADVNDEAKRKNYIVLHTRVMPILGKSVMFGRALYTLADIENQRITKVPEKYVEAE